MIIMSVQNTIHTIQQYKLVSVRVVPSAQDVFLKKTNYDFLNKKNEPETSTLKIES